MKWKLRLIKNRFLGFRPFCRSRFYSNKVTFFDFCLQENSWILSADWGATELRRAELNWGGQRARPSPQLTECKQMSQHLEFGLLEFGLWRQERPDLQTRKVFLWSFVNEFRTELGIFGGGERIFQRGERASKSKRAQVEKWHNCYIGFFMRTHYLRCIKILFL